MVAGAIGNLLEWYDFGLFGYFAPVIARQIMPPGDRLASLLETFGVFAAGFLMRPLGGVVFGYVGDRLGSKRALELSVLLMAVATTLIGLLPSHASIGLAAPFLLTLMRLLQGLSERPHLGGPARLGSHSCFRLAACLSSSSLELEIDARSTIFMHRTAPDPDTTLRHRSQRRSNCFWGRSGGSTP